MNTANLATVAPVVPATVVVSAPALDPRLQRVVLDAVIRRHRALLVRTASENLVGRRRQDAEDVVQDVCLAVLEGEIVLSADVRVALLELLRAVAAEARS
jgi:DNA-directed RNA polymerase specialized sigma24 family protein